jgi:hypothetical protein
MIRKSGHRFSEKIMRKSKKIEHFQRSPDAKPLSPAKRANRHSPREAVLFVGVDILLMTIKPGTAENR